MTMEFVKYIVLHWKYYIVASLKKKAIYLILLAILLFSSFSVFF